MAWTKWLDLVKLLAPIVLANVKGGDKIATVIPVVVQGIQEAEQIKGAKGPEKKDHVLNVTDAAVTALNATGKVKLDPQEVRATVSDGIDTVVQTVNLVHGARPEAPKAGG